MKYRNSNQLRLSIILFIIVIIILIVLLCINHKDILRNDRRYSFQEALQKQTQSNQLNTIDKNNQFVLANNNEVKRAMSISKKDNDLKYMDLSKTVPMNEDEVKHILKNKGILTDQAQTFLKAQDKYQVNIIYLMNHAIIETANGQSELANGIKENNHKYYNFFGIGAFDQDAIATGHSYAKEHNWTTPSKAIMGGTAFIRHQYFENEQITLYQMRWNPKNPGSHQYASDIEWADKIADNMKKDYERLGIKKDKIRRNYYISNK